MNALIYGLTRKQCGVIFANIKNGNLDLPECFSKFMYECIADNKWHAVGTSKAQEWMSGMNAGLQAVFAGNFEEANEQLTNALKWWNRNHAEEARYNF